MTIGEMSVTTIAAMIGRAADGAVTGGRNATNSGALVLGKDRDFPQARSVADGKRKYANIRIRTIFRTSGMTNIGSPAMRVPAPQAPGSIGEQTAKTLARQVPPDTTGSDVRRVVDGRWVPEDNS
jgi:hypothetical protein